MNNNSKQTYLLLSDALFICFYFSVIQESEPYYNIEEIPELKSSDFTSMRGGRTAEKWIRQLMLSEERESKFNFNGLKNKGHIKEAQYYFLMSCLIQSIKWLRINYSHYLKQKLNRRELRN